MLFLLLVNFIILLIYLKRYYVLNNVKTVILMLCVFMFFVLNVTFVDCVVMDLSKVPIVDSAIEPYTDHRYNTYIFTFQTQVGDEVVDYPVVVRRFYPPDSSFYRFWLSVEPYDLIYSPKKLDFLDRFVVSDTFGLVGKISKEGLITLSKDVNIYKKDYEFLVPVEGSGFYYVCLGNSLTLELILVTFS